MKNEQVLNGDPADTAGFAGQSQVNSSLERQGRENAAQGNAALENLPQGNAAQCGAEEQPLDKLRRQYEHLRREFTKKSQQLAELKKSAGVNSITSSNTSSATSNAEGVPEAVKAADGRGAARGAERDGGGLSDAVRRKIVAEYLSGLQRRQAPPAVIGTGGIALRAAPPKPATVAEAGEITKLLFSQQQI